MASIRLRSRGSTPWSSSHRPAVFQRNGWKAATLRKGFPSIHGAINISITRPGVVGKAMRLSLWEPTDKKVKMMSRVQSIWTQDGFSLVELSIVILLLSFLLLLSIPRFGAVLVGQRLNSTGHLITGMVRYLYDQSTAKKRLYRLNYHLKNGEIWVTFPNDEGEFIEDQSSTFTHRRKLPTGIQFEDIVTPMGKVTEGQAYTQFFPTGLVDRFHRPRARRRWRPTLRADPSTQRPCDHRARIS